MMGHLFDRVCAENGIEHRLTKVKHPWTNGQVERLNRTITDATVKRFHYDNHDQLRRHLWDFINDKCLQICQATEDAEGSDA